MPAFVPIMFEMTVFFAAHLMVITFYMRSKLWPFKKAENPDVYAQIFALGQKAENDRVQAWLTYVDADAKTVTEGIKGNEAPSLAIQAELNRKAFSIEALKNLENQNPVIVQTPDATTTEKTAEELKAESIKNDLYKQLNLSK
jgi:hypothetical protein